MYKDLNMREFTLRCERTRFRAATARRDHPSHVTASTLTLTEAHQVRDIQ